MDRYSRQMFFYGIGTEGQEKLLQSRITVIGLGALGSAAANLLARAGIGSLRLVDRDYVEWSNIQRQMLYREKDAEEAVPKAAAAAEMLAEINSGIEIEPVITDVNSGNIDQLIGDADLIIDATDNIETRKLLGEACHALRKPWIYGGALASYGMTMNFLPEDDAPCFNCLNSGAGSGGETCATAGVLGMITSVIASIQCTEAIKILTGSPTVRRTLLCIDIWNNDFDELTIEKNPDCPVCGKGVYERYGKAQGTQTVNLCGRDAVQVIPDAGTIVDFDLMAGRWRSCGDVRRQKFTLDLDTGQYEIKLFPDGRAIIKGTSDTAKAKSIYSEYVGL